MAHFTRQVNWDNEGTRKEKRTIKGDTQIIEHPGCSFFADHKQLSYDDLKKAYPTVVNDLNLEVVIGKLKKSTMKKVTKSYVSVALTQSKLETDFKSFEGPLQI